MEKRLSSIVWVADYKFDFDEMTLVAPYGDRYKLVWDEKQLKFKNYDSWVTCSEVVTKKYLDYLDRCMEEAVFGGDDE